MKALLSFGMVQDSTDLHSMIERLMKAQHTCQHLYLVDQQIFLEKNPMTEEMFQNMFSKQKAEEEFKKTLAEWQDVKFFKH